MAKLKLGIILPTERNSAADVLTYGKSVVKGMNTNATTFPSPTITMTELEDAVDALENSIPVEDDASPAALRLMEKNKRTVVKLLAPQSRYVLLVANGDRYIAGLSGFTLTKEESEMHHVTELELDKVIPGVQPGTVTIRLKGRGGCVFFIVLRKDEHGNFVFVEGYDRVKFKITGLPSGENTIRIYGKRGEDSTPYLDILVRVL